MRTTQRSLRHRLLVVAIVLLALLFLQVAQIGVVLIANTTPGAPLGCGPAPLPFPLGSVPWIETRAEQYCGS